MLIFFRQIDARTMAETKLQSEILHRERESAEASAARNLAAARSVFAEELERKNKELEAFSYSVSHDLRAPLRSIDGFSQLLLEEHSVNLSAKGQEHLRIVRAAAQRMGELIDDLLKLSQVSRVELRRARLDLSAIVRDVAANLQQTHPARHVEVNIEEGLEVHADRSLMLVAIENLIDNAWKFTSNTSDARIEVGSLAFEGKQSFYVRDNGAGFNMKYSGKLFRPFQRLHTQAEFTGTGIGLATVHRVIDRHGGRIWGESEPGQGAVFYFTLPSGNGVS
jgi:light-regulated signal transduction histidine kinase (bacteriophytochrome)